jgi:hypothetical protein
MQNRYENMVVTSLGEKTIQLMPGGSMVSPLQWNPGKALEIPFTHKPSGAAFWELNTIAQYH